MKLIRSTEGHYISMQATVVHYTDRAVLIDIEHGAGRFWVPMSVLDTPDSIVIGADIEAVVPEWFAEEKGII